MENNFGQQQFGYQELIQAAPYLMVFHAVAEEPMIATVAERFELNGDGIRYRLRKLEQLLETKLVSTEYDRAVLTSRGEQLYGYSKSLLSTLTALDRNLRPMFDSEALVVGLDNCVPESWLFNRYLVPPSGTLDGVMVTRGTSEDMRRNFFSGKSVEATLFVSASNDRSKFGIHDAFPIQWAVGAAFDRGRLSNLPVALPARGSVLRTAAIEALTAAAIDWHCAYDASDLATLLEIVAHGHAVSVVPTDCIGGGISDFVMLNRSAPLRALYVTALTRSAQVLPRAEGRTQPAKSSKTLAMGEAIAQVANAV